MTDVPKRKKSVHIRDTRIAGLYDLQETIGQGHFAVVKLAKHVFTDEKVAVKIIDKTNLDPASTVHIMQEVRCMKLVQHANIVRLYEVIDTQTKLFLILELGDYDMHDFILRYEKGVAEPLAQQYFCQIITAIDYCHRLHVVHRDLKPENVVFFERLGMVKLTDFGFSNLYEPGEQLRTSCGSLAYSAPEILLGDAYDAPAVDVWSLGVILFMLVCGRLPFQETNDSETLTKILDCRFTIPDHLSTSCKNLILRMLVREPSKRATLSEIVANPWVTAGDRGHAAVLPLIVRHHLPHSAHTTIIEQMVAGNIGSEEAILSALENDEYNSMTATYYLLAERILSTCREEQAKELMSKEAIPVVEEDLDSTERSSRAANVGGSRCRSRSNSWRARPCSILKEESEEELSTYLRSASRQSSRNSSPSISMFGGSAKDRISPQAVQDLLELSRIGSVRRAASPESIRSSRSPSPPASSSGRTSPAMSSLSSLSRLKVSTSSLSGGMRKLSSSPHLLGICEEGEEGEASTLSLLAAPRDAVSRTNRSASTGLVHIPRHGIVQATKSTGSHPLPTTYSAVRMIRPRHAVVSPDVCRRYEQHQRYVARSRRSTSCSSSEASDDEEGKRLSLIGSKYCGKKKEGDGDKDDDPNGPGGLGGRTNNNNKHTSHTIPGKGDTSGSNPGTNTAAPAENRSGGASESCMPTNLVMSSLLPIPEMTHLDNDKGQRIRARLLHRSHTAERILRDWACESSSSMDKEESWLGTPPRDSADAQPKETSEQWIRRLQRTMSWDDVSTLRTKETKAYSDNLDVPMVDLLISSSKEILQESDSGCSSIREDGEKYEDKEYYAEFTKCASPLRIDKKLMYNQPRCEKVDDWLRSLDSTSWIN